MVINKKTKFSTDLSTICGKEYANYMGNGMLHGGCEGLSSVAGRREL